MLFAAAVAGGRCEGGGRYCWHGYVGCVDWWGGWGGDRVVAVMLMVGCWKAFASHSGSGAIESCAVRPTRGSNGGEQRRWLGGSEVG
eukprot:9016206-Alexandrium_andersonii.AAC.1